jgi:hypothetical protein
MKYTQKMIDSNRINLGILKEIDTLRLLYLVYKGNPIYSLYDRICIKNLEKHRIIDFRPYTLREIGIKRPLSKEASLASNIICLINIGTLNSKEFLKEYEETEKLEESYMRSVIILSKLSR